LLRKIDWLKYFLTFLVLLLFFSSFAQLKLEGVIYHAETGLPIAGVEVEVHETRQKTYTSAKGQFNLVLSPGSYHLHFQSLGFEANDLDLELLRDTSIERILKPTFLELKEVLVEESNLKTIDKNTSLDVEHINFEEGEKSIESSLAEALKKNPGLEAYNTGVGIAKPIIRGFTATRISVYDNGVKQEGQQWGMDHGLEIDPFNTSRVEIIKGAGALQYGSDAIGGVVKLLPDVVPEEGTHGSYTSLYKSNNNTYGNSLKLSYRKGDHFLIARASYQFYDDFRIPAEEFTYNGFVLPVVDNTLKNTAGKLLSIVFLMACIKTVII
jgi:iron complex outermembrane receptor protein